MSTEPNDPSGLRDVGTHVGRKASELQDGYLQNRPAAVSQLAKLRRGVALPIGRDLELLGLTTAGLEPESWRSPEPTRRERAAYTALTLFALHQQSHRTRRMHRPDYSFGRSARLLQRHNGDDAVRRRFNAMATSTTPEELVRHGRGLIQQFRSFDIPLDYAQFARDLVRLQNPRTADAVRNTWGRDFFRTVRDERSDDSPAGADAPSEIDI